MNIYPFRKNKFAAILFVWFFLSLNPSVANESMDYKLIDMLVMGCYKEMRFCNEALSRVHDYQRNAAINKKFSCQTRLLGLEANLIMAMNSNFKRKDARSIIDAIDKYC